MSYFIGIMSGTSLDGVDIALVDISLSEPSDCSHNSKNTQFQFICAHSYPIPDDLKQDLLTLSQQNQHGELDTYARLDTQLGNLFAQNCLQFLQDNNINRNNILAIGSHGQTLRHYPDTPFPTSLQIADPNIIAQQTGITTIADFRRRDMAAGGQGAPLVPPFHHAVFHSPDKNRVIVNIGGIANITFLPATAYPVSGYDTGPGNGLMDDWCLHHFNCPYDQSAERASRGIVHQPLLRHMLDDAFFLQAAPKSTGREYFSYAWVRKHLKQIATDIEPHDVLRTLLELTCRSIANEINLLPLEINELLVCGGGTHNPLLMQRLQELLGNAVVNSTENYNLHPDWVEASAFAWLAFRTLNGLPGNLVSVTGAKEEVILGAIWQA